MHRPHTVTRSKGKLITQWKFIIKTKSHENDTVTFDVFMIENFIDGLPVYKYGAKLAKNNSEAVLKRYANIARKSYEYSLNAGTLPELYKLVEAAASKFENLDWKRIIVIGFDWTEGTHEDRDRQIYFGGKPGRKTVSTEINFDFVEGEQAGAWFRLTDGERLHKCANDLLYGGRDGHIFVLPYDEEVLARLALLRSCFHNLAGEIQKMLKTDKIHGFLAGLESNQKLLSSGITHAKS